MTLNEAQRRLHVAAAGAVGAVPAVSDPLMTSAATSIMSFLDGDRRQRSFRSSSMVCSWLTLASPGRAAVERPKMDRITTLFGVCGSLPRFARNRGYVPARFR